MIKLFSCAIILLTTTCFGQGSLVATVSGDIPTKANDTLTLDNGYHTITKVPVSKTGLFSVQIKIDSGSYYTFDNNMIFLEPNMALYISGEAPLITFKGEGSGEDNLCIQIKNIVGNYLPLDGEKLSVKINDIEPVDFLKKIDAYKSAATTLVNNHPGLNKYFIKTQLENIEYISRWYCFLYLSRYGVDPNLENEYLKFIKSSSQSELKSKIDEMRTLREKSHVKTMSRADFQLCFKRIWAEFDINNSDLYKLSAIYRELVYLRINSLMITAKSFDLENNSQGEIKFEVIGQNIQNNYIKQRLLYDLMYKSIKPDDNLEKNYTKYMSLCTDSYYKREIEIAYNRLKQFHNGSDAPEFIYNDITNKPISLSSYKGKYVYIDLWATWCAPCIVEMPYLKSVEKEFDHHNIAFISISADKKNDADKWKKFVGDNTLGGVQVLADNDMQSVFIKDFNISSIPRFILIGPNGKIVSDDAPRPSDPKLRMLLTNLLNK